MTLCDHCGALIDEGADSCPACGTPRSATVVSGRRNLVNTISAAALRLGVVTWNVAHFGDGKLAFMKLLRAVEVKTAKFVAEATDESLCAQLSEVMDAYQQWELELRGFENHIGGSGEPLKDLRRLQQNHETNRESESDEEDEEGEDDGDVGPGPETLCILLADTWKKFGSAPRGQEDHDTLWVSYFTQALALHDEAWKSFIAEWGDLGTCESEDELQDALYADIAALAGALKELRLAAKMVAKPLLQLRERIKLAKKVMAAAEKSRKSTRTREGGSGPRKRQKGGRGSKVEASLEKAKGHLAASQKASKLRIGELPKIVRLDQVVHRVIVARQVVEMFKRNPWLDIVVLQEVNKGVDALAEYVRKHEIHCLRGPELNSRSGSGTQTEYYPVLVRGRRVQVPPRNAWAVYCDGGTVGWPWDQRMTNLSWSKSKSVYRPVVGMSFSVLDTASRAHLVGIGIVHTSPAGSEFSRVKVFEQVDEPLRAVAKQSYPMVVGGDFYLTSEAVTSSWKDVPKEGKARSKAEKKRNKEVISTEVAKLEGEYSKLERQQKAAKSEQQKRKIRVEMKNQKARLDFLGEVRKALASSQVQYVRNDADLCLSVGNKIKALGLSLAQPLTGTNWKTKGVAAWYDAQIADFFVHTRCSEKRRNDWASVRTGIVHPCGGLLATDGEAMRTSWYWRHCSDHFPVGVVLSTRSNDAYVDKPFERGVLGSVWDQPMWVGHSGSPPRRVLGFVNNLNECYCDAALQLVACMDLENYVLDGGELPTEEDLKTARVEVAGILARRKMEGESGEYQSYGSRHRYSTARKDGLIRTMVASGISRTETSQEDACAALEYILTAFERRIAGIDVTNPKTVKFLLETGGWEGRRPSNCHVVLRTKTRYRLSRLRRNSVEEGVLTLDENRDHTSYRCEMMLRLELPPMIPEPPKEALEEEMSSAESDDELMSDFVDEEGKKTAKVLTLDQLRKRTFEVEYEEGEDDRCGVNFNESYYPRAWRETETTAMVASGEHLIVVLARFGVDPTSPKRTQAVAVDMMWCERRLRAFIVHIGDSMAAGHYVTYVSDAEKWYRVDNTKVVEIDDISTHARSAYILYYAK